MTKTILTFAFAAILAAQPHAHAVLGVGDIVSDPIAEEALIHKNIFDQLKYAWEQTQWADKLATLHNTLTTVGSSWKQPTWSNRLSAILLQPLH